MLEGDRQLYFTIITLFIVGLPYKLLLAFNLTQTADKVSLLTLWELHITKERNDATIKNQYC